MPALKQVQTDSDYHKQTALNDIKKLNSQLKELPGFCRDFFRGIEQTTTTKTRIGYASDLRTFFRFLFSTNPEFSSDNNEKKIADITLSELESLKPVDIEEYMEYLKYYTYNGKQYSNDERGIHRKIASLKSFYLYYQKRELISNNPTTVIDMPKLHDKEIIRLDSDEVAELLELVENAGEHLTGRKKFIMKKIN